MGVKLQSSSGGSVEIAAPVTASNYVLTAPAGSGTVDYLQRAGNVLQVVQATCTTLFSSTSASLIDSGLVASITPSSVANKILVLVSQKVWVAGTNGRYDGYIVRNSTNTAFLYGGYYGSSEYSDAAGVSYLDSPSTTSVVTYKTQYRLITGSRMDVNGANGLTNTITLMEIAG